MSHTQILKELNIDFLGKRRIAAIASSVVLLICLLSMFVRGFELRARLHRRHRHRARLRGPGRGRRGQPRRSPTRASTDAMVQYFGSRRDILIRLAPQVGEASQRADQRQGLSRC
jgi:preprotein translocase subunit SecF